MICETPIGMLVMRSCNEPASSICSHCGRPMCMTHTVMGTAGPSCPQCASTHGGYEPNDETRLADARNTYYSPYGGPAAFGDRGYFSGREGSAMRASGMNRPPEKKKKEYDSSDT